MSLWAESAIASRRLGAATKGRGHLDAVEQVKDWTRERFALADEETVLVAEAASTLPGCPPLETVVAFWTTDGTRHLFKVFKAVREVAQEDIPPAWLKKSLAAHDGFCECC